MWAESILAIIIIFFIGRGIMKSSLFKKKKVDKYPSIACVHQDKTQYNCTVYHKGTDKKTEMSLCSECIKDNRVRKGNRVVLH